MQLIGDVRAALEAAPTFQFESDHTVTSGFENPGDLRFTGEVAGGSLQFMSESVGVTPARRGGIAVVGDTIYHNGDGIWPVSKTMNPLGEDPRSLPEELINVMVHEESEGGATVWVLTAERILKAYEGATSSIQPLQTHS